MSDVSSDPTSVAEDSVKALTERQEKGGFAADSTSVAIDDAASTRVRADS
ncbi:MAG: hypothetical protein AAB250_14820 [Bdellovibrionota bacterium]